MKKYIEIGIGNRWFIRTELEHDDGTETEQKGALLPIKVESIYMRVWIGKTVWILSSKEGWKVVKKERIAFKWVFGVSGE